MSFQSPQYRVFLIVAPLFAVMVTGEIARADEPVVTVDQTVYVDRPVDVGGDAKYQIDRTSLYGDDARVPLPLVVVATSSFSYTNIGGDPTVVSGTGPTAGCKTPCYSTFAGNTAQPGGEWIVTGELGVLPHVSVLGSIMTGFGGTGGVPSPDVGGIAALRVSVFPNSWSTHFVVSGGYVREAYNPPVYNDDVTPAVWLKGEDEGVNAGYLQLAASGDVGRFRFNGMLHGQHTFAQGRDPLDIMVDLNASVRIVGRFRAGLEYVGQDLEETFSPGAEGGPRHFLGPVASIQLWNDRVTVIGGPSIGLSYISPDFVARVAASVGF
jgi:hypothetical protein